MNPLETVLRPVASLLNSNIRATTPARELCEELAGKVIAVRVRDTALAMYFSIDTDSVSLSPNSDVEPDVIIAGSLLTLARLAGMPADTPVGRDTLDLTGDFEAAHSFQRLLAFAKPDIEEQLSGLIGDAAAYRLGEMARRFREWADDARSTMHSNIREYLQEERRELPSRYEVERFTDDVDALRDDVERLEARIDRLRDRS
jgi:ubiquinone biosynthesis protein UbiJ